MNEIKKARETMRKAFDEDPEFKETYIANIAMLLYDNYWVTNYDERNRAAKDILELIFYS